MVHIAHLMSQGDKAHRQRNMVIISETGGKVKGSIDPKEDEHIRKEIQKVLQKLLHP